MAEPTLLDALSQILQTAETALGDRAPANVYLSHSRPPDDCCEILSVWVDPIGFTGDETFPIPSFTPIRCFAQSYVGTVHLLLLRDCWPSPEGLTGADVVAFPAPERIEEAAADLLTQINVVVAALVNAHDGGYGPLLPWPYRRVMWDTVSPVAPLGGCAGWEMTFRIEVPPFCGADLTGNPYQP